MKPLRTRLMTLILVPMGVIAIFIIFMRYELAVSNANSQFDRTLSALTMAVARDLQNGEEGDSISSATSELLRKALGGDIYYHGTGVGGYFIAGYAYPPATPKELVQIANRLIFFDGTHRGQPVRVARLSEPASIPSSTPERPAMTGNRVVTVWQPTARIDDYVWQSVKQTLFAVAALIASVSVTLWIAISVGLRPLVRLERSVAQRSAADLTPITDAVPAEVYALVRRINHLFRQVQNTLDDRERFISNAAHQLKNPVSGIVLMAEATVKAPDEVARQERAKGLLVAAKSLMRFSNQMLSLERARSFELGHTLKRIDLNQVVSKACERMAASVIGDNLALNFEACPDSVMVNGDSLLLQEVVSNLISNAKNHAGDNNHAIDVKVFVSAGSAVVSVRDHGVGFPLDQLEIDAQINFSRFGNISSSEGSGLGLPIVQEIILKHGGRVAVLNRDPGAEINVVLPLAPS